MEHHDTAPIPLTDAQLTAIREWAADDRLWGSRSSTEFNLCTFARVILKAANAERDIRIQELEMDRYVPGRMVCDGCQFQLTTTIMNVATGGFGAPIAPSPEPCPNGCGPLRSLTWRESDEQTTKNLMRVLEALEASVRLQSHYAQMLNMHDGGERLTFEHPTEWMNRLDAIAEAQRSEVE